MKPVRCQFPIYLGLGVYGPGVCVCTFFTKSEKLQHSGELFLDQAGLLDRMGGVVQQRHDHPVKQKQPHNKNNTLGPLDPRHRLGLDLRRFLHHKSNQLVR
jgi:hypothetical protein